MSERNRGVHTVLRKAKVEDLVSLCKPFKTIGKRYMIVKNKILSLRTEGEKIPILGL